jgi:hypothetical protein
MNGNELIDTPRLYTNKVQIESHQHKTRRRRKKKFLFYFILRCQGSVASVLLETAVGRGGPGGADGWLVRSDGVV